MALSNCPLCNTTLAASPPMPTAERFATCLIPAKGEREVCFAVSCEAVGKTHHSKYQHVPVSSIQLSRVEIKCSSLSTTAAIILLEISVCLCRAAVARNTLITFVKCSLSLHFDLKQDGKWYEMEVYFLFLSHFLSAAVNRKGQILMEVHPRSVQHSCWDYCNLLLLVRGRRRGRIDYCVVKCICDAFNTRQSKGLPCCTGYVTAPGIFHLVLPCCTVC